MSAKNSKGIYFALITAVVSGISIFVNKFAAGIITPPLVFTATKNFAVAVVILSLVLLTGKWSKIRHLKRKDIMYLLAIGFIGGSLPFYLFFTGISQSSAINAALIHKTLVLWVALLAVPFLKEKVSRLQIVAILLLFTGNVFVGGFVGFEFSKGELMIMIATLLWAVENIFAKKVLKRVDPDIVTLSRMGIGAFLLMGASIITAPAALKSTVYLSLLQWLVLLLTAAALLGYVSSWYRALRLAPATLVTSVLVSSTLITNVLSALFITHVWDPGLIPQSILILAGTILFLYSSKVKLPSFLAAE